MEVTLAIGHNGDVTTTQRPIPRRCDRSSGRPVAVGTIVWLGSEVMFFAGLFAIYFTLRSTSPELWATETEHPERAVRARSTPSILVLSLVHLPVRASSRPSGSSRARTGWQPGPVGHGRVVLPHLRPGRDLRLRPGVGVRARSSPRASPISSNAYGSAFYLTTGFHGLHVTGGLIAFLLVIGRGVRGQELRPQGGDHRDRRVVLLALRRRGLDRPVPRHLLAEMSSRS